MLFQVLSPSSRFLSDRSTLHDFTRRVFGRLPTSCLKASVFQRADRNVICSKPSPLAWWLFSPFYHRLYFARKLQVVQTQAICLWEYVGNNNERKPHPLICLTCKSHDLITGNSHTVDHSTTPQLISTTVKNTINVYFTVARISIKRFVFTFAFRGLILFCF